MGKLEEAKKRLAAAAAERRQDAGISEDELSVLDVTTAGERVKLRDSDSFALESRVVAQLAAEYGMSVRHKLKSEQIGVDFCTNPTQEMYERFAQRHNSRLMSGKLIPAAREVIRDGGNKELGLTVLKSLKDDALRHGFFLFNYGEDKLEPRFRAACNEDRGQSRFLMLEARATHPDPEQANGEEFCADLQLHLPGAYRESDLVIPQFRDGIDTKGPAFSLFEEMSARPQSLALIEDITVSEKFTGMRTGVEMLETALQHVRDEENPRRGEYPIEGVLAEIATITGIRFPDGTEIEFGIDDFKGLGQIPNGRSHHFFNHFRSELCTDFPLAYRRIGVEYTASAACRKTGAVRRPFECKLIVDWDVHMAQLKEG